MNDDFPHFHRSGDFTPTKWRGGLWFYIQLKDAIGAALSKAFSRWHKHPSTKNDERKDTP